MELALMLTGIALVAAGAAWILPPAGLIAAGALLITVSWPDRSAK